MMHPSFMQRSARALCTWLLCAASFSASTLAAAQEKAPSFSQEDDAEKQIIELFGKVERRLREIDRLLYDAGAGDRSKLARVGPSGMEELLNQTRDSGRTVLDDIDKILELAQQLPSQPSSAGGQGGGDQQSTDPKGQSPLDKQGSTSTERESTPASPKPGGKHDGEKPSPEPPKGEDGQPRDPRASDDKNPRTAPGQNQPSGPTQGASPRTDGKDRWGDLPIHARDVFRIEGGGDMPVQYRDWIDSYYRRLNRKP